MKRALVTGAGGFIGYHLVRRLKEEGYWVCGVDLKHPEFGNTRADRFALLDLRVRGDAILALSLAAKPNEVYALAADMGGMGFIGGHAPEILHNNTLININTIEAARLLKAERYFFASSACVYPEIRQTTLQPLPLVESSAYPAEPDTEYGWEKLYAERVVAAYGKEYGFETRIARFHNIFGPQGTWRGGREKAPAAICRKVAEAKWTGESVIDIWGDGLQTRSFCYVDECVEGIRRLMQSDVQVPVNIGSAELVSINDLAQMAMEIAGVRLDIRHVEGPQGVRGRNSDNTLCRQLLGWAPSAPLRDGLVQTYPWIESQVRANLGPQGAPEFAHLPDHG